MRNPDLEELLSPLAETEAPIEPRSLSLSVEHGARHGTAARAVQEGEKQRTAHPFSSPLLQHRHAPDAPVGKQASRTDRVANRVAGKSVIGALVPFIPFEFVGHPLLLDEHFLAHGPREEQRVWPGHDANGELCGHERLIIRVDQ